MIYLKVRGRTGDLLLWPSYRITLPWSRVIFSQMLPMFSSIYWLFRAFFPVLNVCWHNLFSLPKITAAVLVFFFFFFKNNENIKNLKIMGSLKRQAGQMLTLEVCSWKTQPLLLTLVSSVPMLTEKGSVALFVPSSDLWLYQLLLQK